MEERAGGDEPEAANALVRVSKLHALTRNAKVLDALAFSVKLVYDVLRCLGAKSTCLMHISPAGLRLTVAEAHSMECMAGEMRAVLMWRGNAFLGHEIFAKFHYQHPSSGDESDGTLLQISLKAFIGCLSVFGLEQQSQKREKTSLTDPVAAPALARHLTGSCRLYMRREGSLKLTYVFESAGLTSRVEESGVLTVCSLTSYEPELIEELAFDEESLTFKIILKSEWLADALQEMESAGAHNFSVRVRPMAPNLVLSSTGSLYSVTLEYPESRARTVLETFMCSREAEFTYPWSLIRQAQRAVSASTKASMRVDSNGVMNLQLMIVASSGSAAKTFVEFKILPLSYLDGS